MCLGLNTNKLIVGVGLFLNLWTLTEAALTNMSYVTLHF